MASQPAPGQWPGRRLPAELVTVLLTVLAVLVLPAPTAVAVDCSARNPDGSINYGCIVPGGGAGSPSEETGGETGGGDAPTCALGAPATFCVGANACWYLDHVTPYAPPKGQPPERDADWKVRSCRFPDGGVETGAVWIGGDAPQPPSLQEQAQTAFGRLDPALGTLNASPATTSLVRLPTWFWVDGLAGDLMGSSAFGLVAIARPDNLQVDPGDGSGMLTCEWVTAESDACSHVYERSSATRGTTTVDGHPAYAVTARPVWTISFEMNGTPVNIPGAPTELTGPAMTKGERVVEVQALVNRID